MSQYSHVYAVMQGAFKSGTSWFGEMAQVGLRIAVWPTTATVDTDAPLPIRDCTSKYGTYDDAAFTGAVGFNGAEIYWTTEDQKDVANAMRSWADAIKGLQSQDFEWKSVKLTPISPDGKAAANPSNFVFKTKVAGTNAGLLPPQLAVAASLRSVVPGRRGRGRMYVPALGGSAVFASNGMVGSTATTTLGNATRALLTSIGGIGGGDVNTKVVVTSAGNDRYVLPSEVRIGNQADTQRRRRNGVRETYATF